MTTWTVVVAAGGGERFGGPVPKQYSPLGGHRVLDWSLAVAHRSTDGVVLVVPAERAQDAEPAADRVVAGGLTRSDSVRAGLEALPSGVQTVVVHDAARPLALPALFEAVLAAVAGGADAAVPALPVTDTVKRVAGSRVVQTLDRSELVAVQTPQAFRYEVLARAHADGGQASDDAALVEACGARVEVVMGDPANRKLTRPEDLAVMAQSLGATEGSTR